MKKLITFFGGDSQVGTTMISIAVGELMAAAGFHVLWIGASGNPGYAFLPLTPSGSIDDLKMAIIDKNIEIEELKQSITRLGKLEILSDVRGFTSWGYGEDSVEWFCNILASKYDHILLDVGTDLQSPWGEYGITGNTKKVCVLTQQEKSLERLKLKKDFLGESVESILYVVNKFNDSGLFYDKRQLMERLPCEKNQIFSVSYVPYGWQAEREHNTLLKHRKFRKGVRSLAERLTGGGENGV